MARSISLGIALTAAAFAGAFAPAVSTAQEYPTRSIRMILPFPAGGGSDLVARIIAQKYAQQLGQQVVVDNRAGASGNIAADLAAKAPADGYTIAYYAPQPRAVIEVVDFDDTNTVVPYGGTGRVKLTTLTKETFVPGFLERDEGERELPYAKYPWDGISGVRPFRELASSTTVGVY
jgi:hypothetical protein